MKRNAKHCGCLAGLMLTVLGLAAAGGTPAAGAEVSTMALGPA